MSVSNHKWIRNWMYLVNYVDSSSGIFPFFIQMTHFRTDANFRSSFSVNWSKPMSHQIKCSKRIKLALIDLNGTCHIGNKLINQSNVAIRKLINSGVAVRYVTNTTKESTFSIAKRCKGTIYSTTEFRIFILKYY